MKRRIFSGALAVAVVISAAIPAHAARAADAAPVSKWGAMETTHFVWRKGTAPYTFIIEDDRSNVGQGDETSPRLKIVGPDGKALVVAAEFGFTTTNDDPDLAKLVRDNLIHSKYLYVTPKLRNAAGEPALIVFGLPGGSDPGALRIVMLDAKGAPRVVLAEDTLDLAGIADLDRDGVPEVIGYRSLSQMFDDCLKTYDPPSVFRFASPARGRLVYAEVLSKRYAEAHGLEWAGPKTREDVGVVTCGANRGHIAKPPATP